MIERVGKVPDAVCDDEDDGCVDLLEDDVDDGVGFGATTMGLNSTSSSANFLIFVKGFPLISKGLIFSIPSFNRKYLIRKK